MPTRVVVTTRAGGASVAPYDEFNLARHVGDDPGAVESNRTRLADQLGANGVQFMQQVHGARLAVVDRVGEDVPDVDALLTASPGVPIAVLVADCVPVALSAAGAVAVVHAGRRGVSAGVVAAAVAALRELAAGPVSATIGPAICGRCYEVPAQLQAEVAAVVPAAKATTRAGTPGLDLPAAVAQQLRECDVLIASRSALCTKEDARYYSHRRDGVTGRFAAVAVLTQ